MSAVCLRVCQYYRREAEAAVRGAGLAEVEVCPLPPLCEMPAAQQAGVLAAARAAAGDSVWLGGCWAALDPSRGGNWWSISPASALI